jgi:hypothetical protein
MMTSKSSGKDRPYSQFVRDYMEGYVAGESSPQMAKRCKTTLGGLFVHAATLRRQGVKLPKLSERFDAKYLNNIIRKVRQAERKEAAT